MAAGILATVALATLATGFLNTFSGVDQLARAPIPGVISVSAPRAAEMVVYYEGSVPPSLDELALRVSGPDGVTAQPKPYGLDLRYGHDNQVGTAVASFTTPASGRYLISTTAAESGARLAVGGDLSTGLMLTDMAGMAIGFAALTAIAAVVALLLRRSNGSSRPRSTDGDRGGFGRATTPLFLRGLVGWLQNSTPGTVALTSLGQRRTRRGHDVARPVQQAIRSSCRVP